MSLTVLHENTILEKRHEFLIDKDWTVLEWFITLKGKEKRIPFTPREEKKLFRILDKWYQLGNLAAEQGMFNNDL